MATDPNKVEPWTPAKTFGKDRENCGIEKMVVMFDSLKLVKIPSLTRVCGRSV